MLNPEHVRDFGTDDREGERGQAAWNPSPKVAAARDIAKRFGKDQVIVLMLNRGSQGTIEAISYGRNRVLCADAKALASVAYDAIIDELSYQAEDEEGTRTGG